MHSAQHHRRTLAGNAKRSMTSIKFSWVFWQVLRLPKGISVISGPCAWFLWECAKQGQPAIELTKSLYQSCHLCARVHSEFSLNHTKSSACVFLLNSMDREGGITILDSTPVQSTIGPSKLMTGQERTASCANKTRIPRVHQTWQAKSKSAPLTVSECMRTSNPSESTPAINYFICATCALPAFSISGGMCRHIAYCHIHRLGSAGTCMKLNKILPVILSIIYKNVRKATVNRHIFYIPWCDLSQWWYAVDGL